MDEKSPFFASVQQELYFLSSALGALESSRDRRSPHQVLEDRIVEEGLNVEHLEGLGLYGSMKEDEHGCPVSPPRSLVGPRMADDCLDQLRQLELIDDEDQVTRAGRDCMESPKALQQILSRNYSVAGEDGTRRRVGRWFRRVCGWIKDSGAEREDDLGSVRFRPALCLAEFMRLHFWLREVNKWKLGRPSAAQFARDLVEGRKTALADVEDGEGGLEYAAMVMANAAAVQLEKEWPEAAEKIAAGRSSAVMLCDAGVIYPVGLPGGQQWLRPVKEWRPGGKPEERKKRRKAAQ